MKIKELQKTVNIAWSPAQLNNDIYLAAGTAAQQLDASPNTLQSSIEIYSTNLLESNYDLQLKGSESSKYRFQKIIWSPTGIGNSINPDGLIVGGCEGGHIQIYSASKLLSKSTDNSSALIAHQDKHNGAVRGLDFNPFQHNLLASAASESEIFIWDLNNTTTPMAPGTKTQPLDDIQNVAWNRQVQHILATVFSTKCVIWDLRKNEQIIKLNDQQSRVRWHAIQWHPDIPTQLWLASEDDQAPYVQLWDLRYATAPAKTMQIHQRGVLGLTWCLNDIDLMVSCGKDNKIYCWNPNTELQEGEILSEVATTNQWYSDVQWCPRNLALIASSSFDGIVSIYSLFGGSQEQHQTQTSDKIADSFPGMDQFAQAPNSLQQQTTNKIIYSDLKKAPKWMKKPTSVSFGFGGRLVMFNQKSPRIVNICQVVTEPNLIERSNALEKVIDDGQFIDYCRQKADQMQNQHGRYLWYFIKANFENDPKSEMLNLLGYNKDDITNKFGKYLKDDAQPSQIDQLTKQVSVLSHSDSSEVEADQSTDDSTDLSGGDNNALFDALAAENKVLGEISAKKSVPFKIPTGEGNESLICQALLTGNIEAAAEICMEFNRPAEALIIASTAGSDLLNKIQTRYINQHDNNELMNIINALVTRDWSDVTSRCTLDSWKEALVAALTHNNSEQISYLCDKLGERLQEQLDQDSMLAKNALLCYICAGNIEKLVDSWLLIKRSESGKKLSTDELQDLVEIVMMLRKSLEIRGQNLQPTGKLAEFLAQYAGLLAAQGALNSALSYLGPSQDPELEELRERLFYALGHKQQRQQSRTSVSQNQQTTNVYGKQTPLANRFSQQRASFSNQSGGIPPMPVPQTTGTFAQTNFNAGLPGQSGPAWNMAPIQSQTSNQPWNTSSTQNYNSLQSNTFSPPVPPSVATPVAPPPISSKPPTANENLSRPQRPSSVGSQGSTPLSRSKYVLDPSVSSGPNYGQTMGVYNPQSQPNASSSFTPPYGQFNNNVTAPAAAPIMYQPPLQNSTTFQQFTPAPLISNANQSFTNSSSGYLSGIPPIETAQQALPPPPSSSATTGRGYQKNPTPPPGWNDPPVLKSRQQPKMESTPQVNPITHPIFGMDPNQQQVGQNGYLDPNSPPQYQGLQGGPTQSIGLPPPPPSSSIATGAPQPIFNPLNANTQQQNNPMNYQNSSQQQQQQLQFYSTENSITATITSTQKPQQIENVVAKEKPPLPEEFIYMQTVFDELKNQCQNIAPDPRTKRKFVDVTKRLEALYDTLRENKLSQNTLTLLNQIVQLIQTGDYQNAMNTYATIVSGPDFSQTANFMPGIKVLIQSASDLKVYLR